jgi:outer membrane protein assembly factor BamA
MMNLNGKLLLVITMMFMANSRAYSQVSPVIAGHQNVVNPVDLVDVIKHMLKKQDSSSGDVPVPGVKNRSILPIIGYGPANGAVIGAAVSVTKLLGSAQTTQLSSALFSLSFTSKKQLLLCVRSDIYLPDNKWYITGDIRLLLFAQPTYGLGIYGLNSTATFNVNGTDVSKSVLEQPMRFNYLRVYETVVRQFFPHWYAGLGVNIDYHTDIDDENLKLDTPNAFITSNYFYSKKYGFDPTHYSTNGLSLQLIEDNRDNPINAYKGTYANICFSVNEKIFGSSQNSTLLYYEWRNYIPLKKSKPGYVLAFWTWGDFVTSGNVPYLALPSIGWDTYGRSGRGYIQGRFRGTNMMYGETELRIPISRNGLFGVVPFVNVTTASNPTTDQPLFASLAPGYGVGVRIKMNKKDRTNICIDYGRGMGSSGIYFNIRETF